MAFVPDDAVDNAFTLTPAAWLLYTVICEHRDHRTGRSYLRTKFLIQKMRTTRATLYRARAELTEKHWAAITGPIYVPTLGDFSPVDKPPKTSHPRDNAASHQRDAASHQRDAASHQRDSAYNEQPASLTSYRYPSHAKNGTKPNQDTNHSRSLTKIILDNLELTEPRDTRCNYCGLDPCPTQTECIQAILRTYNGD